MGRLRCPQEVSGAAGAGRAGPRPGWPLTPPWPPGLWGRLLQPHGLPVPPATLRQAALRGGQPVLPLRPLREDLPLQGRPRLPRALGARGPGERPGLPSLRHGAWCPCAPCCAPPPSPPHCGPRASGSEPHTRFPRPARPRLGASHLLAVRPSSLTRVSLPCSPPRSPRTSPPRPRTFWVSSGPPVAASAARQPRLPCSTCRRLRKMSWPETGPSGG